MTGGCNEQLLERVMDQARGFDPLVMAVAFPTFLLARVSLEGEFGDARTTRRCRCPAGCCPCVQASSDGLCGCCERRRRWCVSGSVCRMELQAPLVARVRSLSHCC